MRNGHLGAAALRPAAATPARAPAAAPARAPAAVVLPLAPAGAAPAALLARPLLPGLPRLGRALVEGKLLLACAAGYSVSGARRADGGTRIGYWRSANWEDGRRLRPKSESLRTACHLRLCCRGKKAFRTRAAAGRAFQQPQRGRLVADGDRAAGPVQRGLGRRLVLEARAALLVALPARARAPSGTRPQHTCGNTQRGARRRAHLLVLDVDDARVPPAQAELDLVEAGLLRRLLAPKLKLQHAARLELRRRLGGLLRRRLRRRRVRPRAWLGRAGLLGSARGVCRGRGAVAGRAVGVGGGAGAVRGAARRIPPRLVRACLRTAIGRRLRRHPRARASHRWGMQARSRGGAT